jgi:lipid-binding SYLF domain-containing protein
MPLVRVFSIIVVVSLLVFGTLITPAQKKSRTQDAERHAREAADAFADIMNVKEKAIPKELLDKAEAIAVFPGVIKAAFIVGGRGGQGVISRRIKRGWSAPAFFNISGGSFGPQVGAQTTDYVFLISDQGWY